MMKKSITIYIGIIIGFIIIALDIIYLKNLTTNFAPYVLLAVVVLLMASFFFTTKSKPKRQ